MAIFDFFKDKDNKKEERCFSYNNTNFVIIKVDPQSLNSKIPINFNLFLFIEKSKRLLHYFKSGHKLTPEEIHKLQTKIKDKLYIFKDDEKNLKKYYELSKDVKGSKDPEYITIDNVSFCKELNESIFDKNVYTDSYDYISENQGTAFVEVINYFNVLSKERESYDKIKILLDTAKYASYNTYEHIKTVLQNKKDVAPIAYIILMGDPIARLYFLGLFFCVKNQVNNKNIIFHSIMNILGDKLSKRAQDVYNKYWSELLYEEGLSLDALVNIGEAIKLCQQFEAIIESITPSYVEDKNSYTSIKG